MTAGTVDREAILGVVPQTHLASDNYAPVHPAVLAAIADANSGHEPSYGADRVTERLVAQIAAAIGAEPAVFPVLTGTGANLLGVTAATPRWGAVICSSHGHMIGEEGGAASRLSGIPLLPVPSGDGKLTPALLDEVDWHDGFVHAPQATTLSIANTTELGTVYTPDEVGALAAWIHARGGLLHLDGARLFNALAASGATLAEMTTGAGVDVFSIGATKAGALAAEAVVVVNEAVIGTEYIHKYLAQLPSKARYVSAQVSALLDDGLGVALGSHANAMATALVDGLQASAASGRIPPLDLTQRVDSNQVFARLPRQVAESLRAHVLFYDWDASDGEIRWVTSWDTSEEDVRGFVGAVERAYTILAG